MTVNLRLRCLASGKEYAIADGLVIGRDSDCDIVLDSSEVSRRHARLNVSGVDASIEDLGSTNGITVAGRKVGKGSLEEGQLLHVGGASLLVVADSTPHDVTLLGAHVMNTEASAVLDESEDDTTTFRGSYQLPPGWTREDVAALSDEPSDPVATRQLLQDLLKHHGVTRDQALAALMTLQQGAVNQVLLLNEQDAPSWSIGRDESAAVTIDHPTISNLHATIVLSGGHWQLQDQGSKNGCELNGKHVKSAALEPGDEIKLAKVRLLFDVVP